MTARVALIGTAQPGEPAGTLPGWVVPGGLIALSLVPALAGTVRLAQLAGHPVVTAENARFIAAPIPVVMHIIAVMIYSLGGAFQFAPEFRRRRRQWHRRLGKMLVPAGYLAALSGLWMTQFYPWPTGDGAGVYVERLIAGTAMIAALTAGAVAIVRRHFTAHGAWMIRAYAIGLGAGTQVLTHLPWFLLSSERPGEQARTIMMGAGWVINVAVGEWAIARGQRSETRDQRTENRDQRAEIRELKE